MAFSVGDKVKVTSRGDVAAVNWAGDHCLGMQGIVQYVDSEGDCILELPNGKDSDWFSQKSLTAETRPYDVGDIIRVTRRKSANWDEKYRILCGRVYRTTSFLNGRVYSTDRDVGDVGFLAREVLLTQGIFIVGDRVKIISKFSEVDKEDEIWSEEVGKAAGKRGVVRESSGDGEYLLEIDGKTCRFYRDWFLHECEEEATAPDVVPGRITERLTKLEGLLDPAKVMEVMKKLELLEKRIDNLEKDSIVLKRF